MSRLTFWGLVAFVVLLGAVTWLVAQGVAPL